MIMKKWYAIFLASLVLLLTACGSSEDTSNSGTNNKSKISAAEAYEKAMTRFNELSSLSTDISMDRNVDYETKTDDEDFDEMYNLSVKNDNIKDLSSQYVKVSENSKTAGVDDSVNLEGYLVQDGFYLYVKDAETDQWVKLPNDNFETVMGEVFNMVGPSKYLENLKPFINDFKVEETDTEYILTLEKATDGFKEYVIAIYGDTSEVPLTEEEKESLEGVKFNKNSYVINIDKNTFNINSFDMASEFTGKSLLDKVNVVINLKAQFTNHDGVQSITVPQEVINQAVETQLQ